LINKENNIICMDITEICNCKKCGKRWLKISNVDNVGETDICNRCFMS